MIDHVAVVVPAADEEATIGACLTTVLAAVAELGRVHPAVTADVVVVLDRCADATAAVAAGFAVTTVVADVRNVGRARGLGTAAAVARAPGPPETVWTAHTDADSTVPAGWLVGQLAADADLVLGTVVADLAPAARAAWDSSYSDADGHPHVHGANLGVRADVLDRLGGWPPLEGDEDVTLVRRATDRGLRIARVGGLAVTTSARRDGRAAAGFSDHLRALDRAAGVS